MNTQTAERLLSSLEEALQKLRDAHQIGLLEGDFRKLMAFHAGYKVMEHKI